ncbi:MAG: acylphosphatase [Acidimicrobiales bacterium]
MRIRVVVSGRVQGVWFRDSCRRRALDEGLSGYARNLSDGTVEAAFEGDPDAVGRLVEWCRTGPPRAQVTSVATTTEDPRGDTTFRVH